MTRFFMATVVLFSLSGCSLVGGAIPCTADVNCPSEVPVCIAATCVATQTAEPDGEPGAEPDGEPGAEPGGAPEGEPDARPSPSPDPSLPLCDSDDGCDESESCFNGRCRVGCDGDEECADDEACVDISGDVFGFEPVCLRGCRNSAHCGTGYLCSELECVEGNVGEKGPDESCLTNDHCEAGLLCSNFGNAGGYCIISCETGLPDDGCPSGTECLAGRCGQRCNGCVGDACCSAPAFTCDVDQFSCGPPGW